MKRAIYHTIILLFFYAQISAQEVELSRQVIGSTGSSFQNSELILSHTSGEVVIGTSINNEYVFTQGFHQASNKSLNPITYEVLVKNETCPDTKDGSINLSNFEGCESNDYQIEWSDGQTGSQRLELNAGWYYFELTACGRVINDSVQVGLIYESSCLLKFYTAFSPNGDGVNDVWEIDNIIAEVNAFNEIRIVNRWGAEVRSFRNYNNTSIVWDGKNENGNQVTEGTYYYVALIQDKEYSGYIELTR